MRKRINYYWTCEVHGLNLDPGEHCPECLFEEQEEQKKMNQLYSDIFDDPSLEGFQKTTSNLY